MSTGAKIMAAIDKALTAPAPVKGNEMREASRRFFERPDGANVERIRAKGGVPPQTFERIGEQPEVKSAATKGAMSILQKQQARFDDYAKALNSLNAKSPYVLLAEHQRELAEKSLKDPLARPALTLGDIEKERSARVAALEAAQREADPESGAVCRKILEAALQAANRLTLEILAQEQKAHSHFGVPYEKTSELVLTLKEASLRIADRLQWQGSVSSPKGFLANIVKL